ncbi:MAG: FkbM family methyltransferase [Bacteroidales bacterium]|nr:FkbM family methyltransferase [Bacteroidales bacterium]
MKQIKLLLYRLLGLKNYLRLISRIYIILIECGFGKKKYPEIHYLKTIIKPDFHCIDIGANLGYFSYFMSKYAGKSGKVYSVEPIPLFGEIFKRNVAKNNTPNITLLPYALGAEEKNVKMGMPLVDKAVHHGMTKVIETEGKYEKTFDVAMKIPDNLFTSLEKIDFLKIDVEGYEHIVLSNMKNFLKRDLPIIEAELGGTANRKESISILTDLGYKIFILKNNKLCETNSTECLSYTEDLYFIAR